MPNDPADPAAEERDSAGERTPFASFLDSVVPAKFKNDRALAKALGVDQSYLYRWRRGVRPQVPALLKLATVTGCSVDFLLTVAGYQPGGGKESS
jgi:transcriptional regulator with XRE-family HTH domain